MGLVGRTVRLRLGIGLGSSPLYSPSNTMNSALNI